MVVCEFLKWAPSQLTFQLTVIAPFYLYAQPNRPWMCLLRAFAIWWVLAWKKVQNLDGLVFHKRIGTDSISVDLTDALVCSALDSSHDIVAEYSLLMPDLPSLS